MTLYHCIIVLFKPTCTLFNRQRCQEFATASSKNYTAIPSPCLSLNQSKYNNQWCVIREVISLPWARRNITAKTKALNHLLCLPTLVKTVYSKIHPTPSTQQITDNTNTAVNREGSPGMLHNVWPSSKDYTYVIEKLAVQSFPTHDSPQLQTTLQINLSTKDEEDKWLSDFMEHSKSTYHVTKTTKSSLKRVVVKYTMHCQHHGKVLSQRQLQSHSWATLAPLEDYSERECKRKKQVVHAAWLTLTILIPTNKQTHLAESKPYLLTHKAVLKLEYCHNYLHVIHSAHSLSFRPISDATKQWLFSLFVKRS